MRQYPITYVRVSCFRNSTSFILSFHGLHPHEVDDGFLLGWMKRHKVEIGRFHYGISERADTSYAELALTPRVYIKRGLTV